MSGLSTAGFSAKRLADIADELKADLRAKLNANLTFDETSPETQILNALADRLAELWEEAELTYLSQYPDTAEGVSLDRVGTLNMLSRLAATTSKVTLRLVGDEDTAVAAGDFEASVSGNPAARFVTTENALLETAYNSTQVVSFSDTPASGAFTLLLGAEETASIAYDDLAADLQTALEALSAVGAGNVAVTGTFAAGFTVTFQGSLAHTAMDVLTVGANTLEDSGTEAVDVAVVETQPGGYGDDVEAECLLTGPYAAPALSCTVIETATTGVDYVFNPADADLGSDLETDAAFRLRRAASLQRSGTAPLEGIRTAVSLVTDVDTAYAFENATDTTDGEGRPPHSVEVVALGGDDEDIARAIWDSKAAGIQTHGTETVTFTDDLGVSRTVKFSRPEEVEIYMEVDITPNTDPNESDVYPADGDDLVKAAILAFAETAQTVGRDVITTRYFTPCNEVPGVDGIVIRVGTAPDPATSDNVTITARQVAVFDTARITVDSTP